MGRAGWLHGLYLYFGQSRKESQQIVTDSDKDNQIARIDPSVVQMWVVRDSNPDSVIQRKTLTIESGVCWDFAL